jgi:AGZA family xanthine/uracil permease-like MFS transporter
LANGAGSILAALFGSCFPTTIYIGHPGWKALGARSGYSTLNGLVISLLCLTGSIAALNSLIPEEAAIAILLWIGIIMVAQAFQATPAAHAPAVALGFLPSLAAWGLLMSQSSGFIFSSMILAAMAAALIDREHLRAAGWAFAAAVLSWLGVIHAWEITPAGVVSPFGWAKAPAVAGGYFVMAVLFGAFARKGQKSGPAS